MTRTRILIILGAAIYIASLQWTYREVMVPMYSYVGMIYQPQSLKALVIACFLAFVPTFWLPKEIVKPSQFQNWSLYLTVIVPSCIVPYHVTRLPAQEIHVFLSLIVVCFIALCGVSSLPRLRLPTLSLSTPLFGCALAVFTLFVFGWLVVLLGVPSWFLPLKEVYDLREKLRSANLPALLGYLIFWQGLVVTPMIISFGVIRRNALVGFLGIILQVVLYNITSLKIFLLATVYQLVICLFLVTVHRRRGASFILGMVAMVALACVWLDFDSHAAGPLLFLERWIFNSGQLSGYYLEFFSRNAHAGLASSSIPVMRWLFPGPYDLPIGQVIGREYFIQANDGVYSNATAHFWADAYASFGNWGVIAATLIAGVLLWLVDAVCCPDNRQFALMAFALTATSLAGQSVLTSILTGGLAPFFGLMLFAPRRPGLTCNKNPRASSSRA